MHLTRLYREESVIQQVSVTEMADQPAEWILDEIHLGQINLFIGRNSVGKTRLTSCLNTISRLLSGEIKEIQTSADVRMVFKTTDHTWDYHLRNTGSQIDEETLLYDGEQVISRHGGGVGLIQTHISNDKGEERDEKVKFKTVSTQTTISAKRDAEQYPYIEDIAKWGDATRLFSFGSNMNAENLAVRIPRSDIKIAVIEKDTHLLVPIYVKADILHSSSFNDALLKDMNELGYDTEKISLEKPPAYLLHAVPIGGDVVGVTIKERDLNTPTYQPAMSSGLFRSLSLLAQLNYYKLSGSNGCIIVDDIGEGLDYERSCILISLVRKKILGTNMQLVMTTNNRFVMNSVPLEEVCLMTRLKNRVSVANYTNSKAAFDRFKITGMNNFDLMASDFMQRYYHKQHA